MSKKKEKDAVLEELSPEVEAVESLPEQNGEPLTEEETPQEAPRDDALAKAEAQAEEYLAMAKRVQADFENFRRRNNQVRAEAYEDGARDFIKTVLPVLDNLERALASETQDEKLLEGVEMTYRMMLDILEKRGVTVIDRKGEKFDPKLENAVMRVSSETGEPGTVAEVFQKGYRMGDSVLRYAMVQVFADEE